jgi:hypothetical protein
MSSGAGEPVSGTSSLVQASTPTPSKPSAPRRRHRGYIVGLLLLVVGVCVLVDWKIALVFTERVTFATATVILVLIAILTELLCRVAALASASRQVQPNPGAPPAVGSTPPGSSDTGELTEHASTTPAPEPAPATVPPRLRSGLRALGIGADGRSSTSKVAAALWTVAILYALLVLLMLGRTPNCPDPSNRWGDCPSGKKTQALRQDLSEVLGEGFRAEYLLLLGLPVGTAVFAKWSTASKVEEGKVSKPPPDDEQRTVVSAVTETIANDRGELDLLDFQYMAFTVFALGYFFLALLTQPQDGLPEIPEALLALVGASTVSYAVKKGMEGGEEKPTVTAVVPSLIIAGTDKEVAVTGRNFLSHPANKPSTLSAVTLGGRRLRVTALSATAATALVPDDLATLGLSAPQTADRTQQVGLRVIDERGAASDETMVNLRWPNA